MKNDSGPTIAVTEDLFQDTLAELKIFHEEKMELIKKFRTEDNRTELQKIGKSLSK